jgi:hypothetical protein
MANPPVPGDSGVEADLGLVFVNPLNNNERKRVFIDVSVIHPTEDDHSRQAGYCAKQREKEKHAHYAPSLKLAGNADIEIVPFVLESYGAWGTEALSFLSAAFANAPVLPPEDMMSWPLAVTKISVALQEGNAALIERTMGAQIAPQFAPPQTEGAE